MRQLKISPSILDRSVLVMDYLHDIGRIPMLSDQEEFELALKARAGDERARQKIVEANLRFVVSVAKQYQNRGIDLCDLIAEGNIGLMRAVDLYNPTLGFKFISYAVWWIRQQIIKSIPDMVDQIHLPHNQIGRLNQIQKARSEFIHKNGREPSEAELAEMLGIKPDQVADALDARRTTVSFDSPIGQDSDTSLVDMTAQDCFMDPEERVERASLSEELDSAMSVLTERESSILKLSFGIGCREHSLDEIADTVNLSRERVRQVRNKAIRKLNRPEIRNILVSYL